MHLILPAQGRGGGAAGPGTHIISRGSDTSTRQGQRAGRGGPKYAQQREGHTMSAGERSHARRGKVRTPRERKHNRAGHRRGRGGPEGAIRAGRLHNAWRVRAPATARHPRAQRAKNRWWEGNWGTQRGAHSAASVRRPCPNAESGRSDPSGSGIPKNPRAGAVRCDRPLQFRVPCTKMQMTARQPRPLCARCARWALFGMGPSEIVLARSARVAAEPAATL